MRLALLLTISLTIFSISGYGQDLATSLGIVPRPRTVTATNAGVFTMTDRCMIYATEDVSISSAYLVKSLKASTGKVLTVTDSKPATQYIQLSVNEKLESASPQAYRLGVSGDQITIEGKSPVAVFYGVQTLLQLMPVDVFGTNGDAELKWVIPAVSVVDEPYFKQIRGLHIDVSREYMLKEEILKVIDYLAVHKMNILHLHLTDHQGWRMPIDAYPKLTTVGATALVKNPRKGKKIPRGKQHVRNKTGPSFYTKEELKEIVAYGKKHYVTVFPEIDMPGHMRAAIRAYPWLKATEYKGGNAIRLDVKGIEFCKNVLKEVHEVFGDVPIHIGFDEVNMNRAEKDCVPDAVLVRFATAITDYIQNELKTTPILWDEAFEMGMTGEDLLIQVWRVGHHQLGDGEVGVDEQIQKGNQPYILSPHNRLYFDMKQDKKGMGNGRGLIPTDLVYEWDPMVDLNGADPAKRHLARGVIACTWGETIDGFRAWQQFALPRLAALSEKTWTQPSDIDTSKPSWMEWRDTVLIKKQLERYKKMDIQYWSWDNPQLLLDLKGGNSK